MALSERTRLYELLVRIDRDADRSDRIRGMHVQTITEVLRDDEVVASSLNPPVPIGFAGLVDLMHPEDLAELAAEVARRAG